MSARVHMAIDPETRAILAAMTVEGVVAKLPPQQLARPVYDKVNKALVALGGKWNRRQGGHVFASDPSALLRDGVETGAVEKIKTKFQFFETPADLAARMAGLGRIEKGTRVLEPSAGHGRLALAARALGGEVTALDINPACCAQLVGQGFETRLVDFTAEEPVEPLFDVVLMNPPFAGRQDIQHITLAWEWLRPGGRLVAICSAGSLVNGAAVDLAFQGFVWRVSAHVERLPAGTFQESGTMVSAALIVAAR